MCLVESSEDLLISRESVATSSRLLQADASRHGRKPNCPYSYVDRTSGNAFWWQCASGRCPGEEPWATSNCDCACVSQADFAAIRSNTGASMSAQTFVTTSKALMSAPPLTSVQTSRQPSASSTSTPNFLAPYLTTGIATHTTQSQLEFPDSAQAYASPDSKADGRRDSDHKLSFILVIIAISLSYIIGCAVVGLCVRKYKAFAQQRANAKVRHARSSEAPPHSQKMSAPSSKLSRVHPDQNIQATMPKSVVVVQPSTGHPKKAKFMPQPLALKRSASGGSGLVGTKVVTVQDKSDTSTCTPSRSSSQVSVDAAEVIDEEKNHQGGSQTARLG